MSDSSDDGVAAGGDADGEEPTGEQSSDTTEQSTDTTEESSDTTEQSTDTTEQSSDTTEQSTDTTEQSSDTTEQTSEELRQAVEEKYDWDDFGPRDMQEMSPEEWDAAFDPDSWITGTELLDRVEKDLLRRVAERDVFAVVEREVEDGEEVVVAYADEGFAVVYPDGSVEGSGTVLRDVKPTVALCSMPDYEVAEPPEDAGLPDPESVPEGSGELGHTILQTIGIVQLLFGVLLLVMPFTYDPFVNGCAQVPNSEAHQCVVAGQELVLFPLGDSGIIAALAGIAFLVFGVFMLVIVANARLSDRFRAEEFRERLRSSGVGEAGERAFVSDDDQQD